MGDPNRTNWLVAWLCSFICFVLLGVARLNGLLFVVVMDSYSVSRSEASLPFVLCYTVRNIAGPLIGYLGRRFGLRKICLIGCLLSAAGIGFCFFAENLITVTVLWGGIFGLGLGLGTVLIPEILRQHFSKDIAKANGIAFGGECLAGFLLPVLLDVSLRTYGAQGTFLIMSGLILNSIPTVLLLKKPSYIQVSKYSTEEQNTDRLLFSAACTNKAENTATDVVENGKSTEKPKLGRDLINSFASFGNHFKIFKDSKKNNTEKLPSIDKIDRECNNFEKVSSATKRKEKLMLYDNLENEISIPRPELVNSMPNLQSPGLFHSKNSDDFLKKCTKFVPCNKRMYHSYHHLCDYSHHEKLFYEINKTKGNLSEADDKRSAAKSFTVFFDIEFLLILFTQSSFIYIATTVYTIVVDYSKDIGVMNDLQIYIVMGMSVADMIGRFLLGFVTDSGIMTEIAFSSAGFAIMGILLFACVWIRGFVSVMLVMFLIGLLIGGLLIVFPGIVCDNIEEHKITMALASRLSLYGPLSLTQSPLIGYFRGTLGSYDGVMYILTALCFICSLFTVLTPVASKRRIKKHSIAINENNL